MKDKRKEAGTQEVSIDSEAFRELQVMIDAAMNQVLGLMEAEGRAKGSVSAKIDFELYKEMNEDGTTSVKPKIGFNVTYDVPRKGKMNGSAPLDIFLGKDQDGGYILSNMQISMDELLREGA